MARITWLHISNLNLHPGIWDSDIVLVLWVLRSAGLDPQGTSQG